MPEHERLHNVADTPDPEPTPSESVGSSSPTPEPIDAEAAEAKAIELDKKQRKQVKRKLRELSAIAKFIGKDFKIPVKASKPGAGWYWNFRDNEIFADPVDLLEKEDSYLKFVIAHEGSHRRITRIPESMKETIQQPGFMFMVNCVEDPRVNNFLADSYPAMRGDMVYAYQQDMQIEQWAKEKSGDRQTPRFVQAGFELIKQWSRDEAEKEMELSEGLPDDVREAVDACLDAAQEAWWTYPSRAEADSGEDEIMKYSELSLRIMEEQIWPHLLPLYEADVEDRAEQLQEQMQQNMDEEAGGPGLDMPSPPGVSSDTGEPNEPEQTPEPAPGSNQPNSPEPTPELTDEQKQAAREQAAKELEDLAGELADKLGSWVGDSKDDSTPLPDLPEPEDVPELPSPEAPPTEEILEEAPPSPVGSLEPPPVVPDFKSALEGIYEGQNAYEEIRHDLAPIINSLEQDLRAIFVARSQHRYKAGFNTGRRINISKRMQEKAQGISAVESRSWERRELPSEKDYAISLLVDLSGSMNGAKINETFKAVVVLAEVLNRLGINMEILGFNEVLHEFKPFGRRIEKSQQESLGEMLDEVRSYHASWNDDGWAIQQASERLDRQRQSEKFLIVLSDGEPAPSAIHGGAEYDLKTVVQTITSSTHQKILGLGIGPNTEHVARYYPNSLADVSIEQMAETIADVLRDVIERPQTF